MQSTLPLSVMQFQGRITHTTSLKCNPSDYNTNTHPKHWFQVRTKFMTIACGTKNIKKRVEV